MSQRGYNTDFFREPQRTELITRLCNPRECCSEYPRCSEGGRHRSVFCELSGKTRQVFVQKVELLMQLSDRKGWYPLREALHELEDKKALKPCTVFAAMVAVAGKIRNERELAKARSYEVVQKSGVECIEDAIKSLEKLRQKIDRFDSVRPETPLVKNFTTYKQALSDLTLSGLVALSDLYKMEAISISVNVLNLVEKTSLRQIKADLLDPSSTAAGDKHWEQLLDLLDALEEIARRPDPSEWIQHAPRRDSEEGGNALRQDVKKLAREDIKSLADWFDLIAPGLYQRFEYDPDQVAILEDVLQREPLFRPLASYVIQLALAHRDDLVSLLE